MTEALPVPKQVRDVLSDLFNKDVTVNIADVPSADDVSAVAVYTRDPGMTLHGVIGFDLQLAANAAAAMGLVPPGGAEACVEDGELSGLLTDILKEVCNILTVLFTRDGGPHVKFNALYTPAAAITGDIRPHLAALGNRLDLKVDIAGGYKGGMLSVVATP
ncbi:hypothetical protein V5P93_002467 [Actinokineospora auranticolor]|uniref:Chemotaxis phosphatase CheX-like protein n=1 Tax=Actinokineospora auranticolor TaxID=155976 RepID=A0A2S6GMN6_9PSEU|nr:hypothetical protein [Actinokineospora auranticolor]PPK66502.1 hypothetical protein CLV40_110206 [Actinokineospora auranticolor]